MKRALSITLFVATLTSFFLITRTKNNSSSPLLDKLHIHKNQKSLYQKGYNNIDIRTNGELNVLKSLVKDGDIIFDIGANRGEWSAHITHLCKPQALYAFEPIPDVFKTLQKSLSNRSCTYCFQCALSDKNSTQQFVYYKDEKRPDFSQLSSFFRRPIFENRTGAQGTSIDVNTMTLDSFCKQHKINHIDFLKIDTEGSELNVLKGAHTMLKNHNINVIQFEYGGTYPDANITLEQVYNFLAELEYDIYRIVNDGLIHVDSWHTQLENNQYSNYLAVAQSISAT